MLTIEGGRVVDIVERIQQQTEKWLEEEPERQWWNYQKDHKEAASEITRLREDNKLLREALGRQCDNVAFMLNRMTIPEGWFDRFNCEVEEDRRALAITGGE